MILDLIKNKYTENILRANANSFNNNYWVYVSIYQILSEDFIIEYKDNFDWDYISRHQKLSLKFIIEHKDHIRPYWLNDNKHLTKEDKAKLKLMGIL